MPTSTDFMYFKWEKVLFWYALIIQFSNTGEKKKGGGLENTEEKTTQVDGTLNQSHPGMPEIYT